MIKRKLIDVKKTSMDTCQELRQENLLILVEIQYLGV